MKSSRVGLLFMAAAASLGGCGPGGAAGPGGGGGGTLPCPPDFADCDGDPENGCEGALSTSIANCGACGVACEAGSHETPLCSAGTCIRVCDAGFADCNGDPADSCEVDVKSDVDHCGACERSCKEACVKGACDVLTLAAGQDGPGAVALDDESVYWANLSGFTAGTGSILKMGKGGGAAVTLAGGQDVPQGIALDATSIYWVNMGTPPAFTDGSVWTTAKDGSGVPAEIAAGQAAPFGIAVQGSALYWTTADQIMTIDMASPGAQPVILAGSQSRPREVVAVGTVLYWVNVGTFTNQMPNADGSVMMLPQGGAPVALASELTLASGLIVDSAASHLYWTVEGAIMRAPVGGASAEVFVDELPLAPWKIAADTATVYWTELVPFGGAVNATAVSTRQTIPLAPDQTWPWGIAIDPTSIYWASYSDGGMSPMTGSIMKVDR
jgi:hypothetical protein